MRSHRLVALFVVAALVVAVLGQDAPSFAGKWSGGPEQGSARAESSSRFSNDMITLLRELSEPYELNRTIVPHGKFDDEVLAKLVKSAGFGVRRHRFGIASGEAWFPVSPPPVIERAICFACA